MSWLNGLGTTPGSGCNTDELYYGVHVDGPGLIYPSYLGGPRVTLTFRSKSGAVLGRARLNLAGTTGLSLVCNPIGLTVGRGPQVHLLGEDLLSRVDKLLDVDLTPPSLNLVAECIDGHGWTTHATRHGLRATKHGRNWMITLHDTGKLTLSPNAPPRLARCRNPLPQIVLPFANGYNAAA